MTAPVSQLRYLRRRNLENEARLQLGYYRELTQSYGVDVVYYHLGLDFFVEPASANTYANYTYGESPASTYSLSSDMVLFMTIDSDSPLLKSFGIETITNCEATFIREDFTETFRDIIGEPTTNIFSTTISSEISGFSGLLSGDIIGNGLSGYTSANTVVPSGTISGAYSAGFTRYPKPINPDLYRTLYYTDRVVLGNLTGVLTGNIDVSGNGIMVGDIQGTLNYFNPPSLSAGPNFSIAPQVGDYIRITEYSETDGNYPEFEISEILDQDLSPNGVNPHLHKYIWRCRCVRRDPSREDVAGSIDEEAFTPQLIEENNWHEFVSDNVFDYENPVDQVDGTNSDNAYGGFSYDPT